VRLASVEVIPYSLPFRDPYVTARGTLERRQMVLLRLRDEEGVVGLGEAVPLALRGGADLERIVKELRALDQGGVFDQALQALAAESELTPGAERFDGQELVAPPTRCAALMALRDLWERRSGAASAGAEPIPCNATLVAAEPAAVAEDAREWAAEGFASFKLKLGAEGEDDVAQVRAVREALGPEARIRVDANGAWPLHTARRILGALEELDVEFAEQPVAEVEEAAELAWQTTIPLAADESVASARQAETATRLGAFRLTGIKLSKVGGAPEARAIAAVLHPYVSSALDGPVGIAAGAQLAQSLRSEAANPFAPRFAHGLATQRLFAGSIAAVECELREGMLHTPAGPGLGVEIDEDALATYRI
jgi:o-succinylbenzoate synthase